MLIDRANHHLFQPLLYQVATGILAEGVVAPALRSVLRGQTNGRWSSPRSLVSTWTRAR